MKTADNTHENSPKANFDNIYAMYSPKQYVEYLVGELNYELPFQTVAELQTYIDAVYPEKSPTNPVEIAVIGSSHGLDAVALNYGMTSAEIMARWSDETMVTMPFDDGDASYTCTLIDIEPEPLRFALDVNLAKQIFVADLSHDLSADLAVYFRTMADVIVGTGMISYMGVEGLDRLLQAAFGEGKAQLFCFSALKFLEVDAFITVCKKYGLVVEKIIHGHHRIYQSEAEKQRVQGLLVSKGLLSEEDEHGLDGYVFLAYRQERQGNLI
ncbi:MAG: hypothetical protein AAF639_43285 [Chloroflexota bacterium]